MAWPYSSTARLKGKDLIGQPWLLAFALRADGWWLRSDIQWSKPNPMPESVDGWRWEPHRVRDPETGKLVECPGCPKCEPNDGLVLSKGSWRPTKAHEVVFMLAKSESYFCDAEAVRGPDAGLPSGNGFAGRQGGERATAIKGGVGSVERFQPGVGRNARS